MRMYVTKFQFICITEGLIHTKPKYAIYDV